jgi:hypothetical protein
VVFLCCTRYIVEAVNSQLCIVLHYTLSGVGIEVRGIINQRKDENLYGFQSSLNGRSLCYCWVFQLVEWGRFVLCCQGKSTCLGGSFEIVLCLEDNQCCQDLICLGPFETQHYVCQISGQL